MSESALSAYSRSDGWLRAARRTFHIHTHARTYPMRTGIHSSGSRAASTARGSTLLVILHVRISLAVICFDYSTRPDGRPVGRCEVRRVLC